MTGPDTPASPEDGAAAAEYVLGLMTPGEEEVFEARILADPALEAEVVAWTERLSRLTDSVAPVTPDPTVKARIEALAFGETARAAGRSWARLLLPYLGGAVAAALVAWFAFSLDLTGPDTDPGATLTAELAPTEPAVSDVTVLAEYDTGTGTLRVVRALGDDLPLNRSHELWLIAGEASPISLGLLDAEGEAVIPLPPALQELLPGAVLAVSEEPRGGSTTGLPTGPVRAAGAFTAS